MIVTPMPDQDDELFENQQQALEFSKLVLGQLKTVFGSGDQKCKAFEVAVESQRNDPAKLKKTYFEAIDNLSVGVWGAEFKLKEEASFNDILERIDDCQKVLVVDWQHQPSVE